MNWHGDAMLLVGTQGDASNNYNINYDPWGGNALPHANPRNYYGWNAQWGYQYFADLGMYYAHGRWWRADVGIFLSPSEESGEYRYGSGQDAVNEAWKILQPFVGCAADFAGGTVVQFTDDQTFGAVLGIADWFGAEPKINPCANGGYAIGRTGSTTFSAYLTVQGLLDLGAGGTLGGLSLACEGVSAGICTPVAAVGGAGALTLVLKGTVETVYGGAVVARNATYPPIYLARGYSSPPVSIVKGSHIHNNMCNAMDKFLFQKDRFK